MSEEKKVHVRLVRHKWADEIEIEKKNRRRKIVFICAIITAFIMGSLFGGLFSRPVVYQGNSDFISPRPSIRGAWERAGRGSSAPECLCHR